MTDLARTAHFRSPIVMNVSKSIVTRDGVVRQSAELTARIIVGANDRCDWNYHGNGLNSSKTRATSM